MLEARDDAGRARRALGADGLPLRHRAVVVPHARGVRPLLPAARHDLGRAARPDPARPRLPRLLRDASRPGRRARRSCRRRSPLFESIEPGAGAALERYLDSADETYASRARPLPLQRLLDARDAALAAGAAPHRPTRPAAAPAASTASSPGTSRDPRLRQMLGYPAVFLGSSPFAAPSLYHLMSHLDLDDGVLYPQGGFREVIDSVARLARASGCAVRHRRPGHRHRGRATVGTGHPLRRRRRRRATKSPPTSSSRPPTCTTPRPSCCLPRRAVDRMPRGGVPTPDPVRCSSCWASAASCPSCGTTPCCSPRTGTTTSPASSAIDRRCPTRRRCTSASRAPATPRSRPPATRTSSCSCRCPPTRPSAAGGIDGAGDAAVERVADAAIAQIAEWTGIPDLAERIVVRRTVGPGDFAADFNSWRGIGARPGAHAAAERVPARPARRRRTVDDCTTPGRRPCRASACRCA